MPLTDAAKANHDRLFGDTSTLARTDPELIGFFDNTRARLLAVLTVITPFIGYPRTLNALAAVNDIATR